MLTGREKLRGTRVVVVIDREKKDEGRKVMEAGSYEAEGKNGDWLGGRRFRLQ